jgi:hypothetical protein
VTEEVVGDAIGTVESEAQDDAVAAPSTTYTSLKAALEAA